MSSSMKSRLLAEALGSALLLATVIDSGVMGSKLAGGNVALALLGNTIATGAILVVLILIFGPVSGAHFNPVVTAACALRGEFERSAVLPYFISQVGGAIIGVWLAHAMFELPLWQVSATVRFGTGQWIAEATATLGLLLTIFGCLADTAHAVAFAVGLYITTAYWFTASTSFANPAVSIARAFSDTFAGIAPASVPGFIVAQAVGGLLAIVVAREHWSGDQSD